MMIGLVFMTFGHLRVAAILAAILKIFPKVVKFTTKLILFVEPHTTRIYKKTP